jgi:hypothetical protein
MAWSLNIELHDLEVIFGDQFNPSDYTSSGLTITQNKTNRSNMTKSCFVSIWTHKPHAM